MFAARACVLLATVGACDAAFGLERRADDPGDDRDYEVDAGAVDAAPALLTCPSNYVAIGNSFYRIAEVEVGWEEASSKCLVDGSPGFDSTHLAVWADDAERIAVAPMIGGFHWIGLSDLRTKSVLRWNTGETGNVTASIAWAPGQPSGSGCVTIRDDDRWEIVSCEAPRGYICECDATPNDTSQYQ